MYLLDSSHHNVLDGLLQRHYLLNLLWRGERAGDVNVNYIMILLGKGIKCQGDQQNKFNKIHFQTKLLCIAHGLSCNSWSYKVLNSTAGKNLHWKVYALAWRFLNGALWLVAQKWVVAQKNVFCRWNVLGSWLVGPATSPAESHCLVLSHLI